MTIAIIDYGSGNLRSAAKAFERVAGDGQVLVTASPDDVMNADHIVLPGVGAFGDCRRGLYAVDGMVEALEERVIKQARPFLGICVGMQLMATKGIEFGEHAGLDWIPGTVKKIEPKDSATKIPHMGWNDLGITLQGSEHPVVREIDAGAHAYFVHSFACEVTEQAHLLATTEYSGSITALIGRDNLLGTQFHPEKSQGTGLKFLESFSQWRP
jgi:glutamine amidotransferase